MKESESQMLNCDEFKAISANGGGRTVTPQQEVGESGCCPAWTDTMAYIIINYSWHLILPRGRQGVRDNARVHLRARALVSPWV